MESVIQIETRPDKNGKTSWVMHHWFQLAKFDKDSGVCTMVFDRELANFLKELKRVYAKINLQDFGKLQSKYALRYFEIAKSYESLAGKDGNRQDEWYFERTIQELRKIPGVPEEAYQEIKLLRRKVIEEPMKELNGAGVGIVRYLRGQEGISACCACAGCACPYRRRRIFILDWTRSRR